MTVRAERTAPCRVTFTATADAAEVAERREQVTSAYTRSARLDGFRRGKAPRGMVERRFADEIRKDVEEELIHQAWLEARREHKLRPAGPLEVRSAGIDETGAFAVTAELDVYPEVEPVSTASFTPPPFDVTPADDEVAAALEELRERQAAWEPLDEGVVDDGLLVEAEVFGEFPDGGGEPFHEERTLFQVGRDEVFPEIEAAVKGHAIGDAVSVTRILGEDAGSERMGKPVAYRVVIKSLRRKRLPEVDEALAASVGIAGGLDELRRLLRERIARQKLGQRHDAWRDALIEHLAGGRTLELPEHVLLEETREEVGKFASTLASRGVALQEAAIDWERVRDEMKGRVAARMRGELLLDAAAEAAGIVVEDDEVDAEITRQAAGLKVPFAELKGNLVKQGGYDKLRAVIARERLVDEVVRRADGAAGDRRA